VGDFEYDEVIVTVIIWVGLSALHKAIPKRPQRQSHVPKSSPAASPDYTSS
jgi:hypothetical protein